MYSKIQHSTWVGEFGDLTRFNSSDSSRCGDRATQKTLPRRQLIMICTKQNSPLFYVACFSTINNDNNNKQHPPTKAFYLFHEQKTSISQTFTYLTKKQTTVVANQFLHLNRWSTVSVTCCADCQDDVCRCRLAQYNVTQIILQFILFIFRFVFFLKSIKFDGRLSSLPSPRQQ
jgi:hypothetical protein